MNYYIDKNKSSSAPLVFAHRGASGEYPENTLPAITRAVELGADYIEIDIRFTKDGRFAVTHDKTLNSTTNGTGNVADYTMNELKNFDAGYHFTNDAGSTYPYRNKGVKIISLDELLSEFHYQKFDIDIKDKNPEQIKPLIEIIVKYNAHDRIIIASKYLANLKEVRKICPQIATAFSIYETLWLYTLYKTGFLFLNIFFKGSVLQIPENYGHFKLVTNSFIKTLHGKGIKLHVWTVNKEEDMKRLIDMGVDGIMTDNPALLQKILGRCDKSE